MHKAFMVLLKMGYWSRKEKLTHNSNPIPKNYFSLTASWKCKISFCQGNHTGETNIKAWAPCLAVDGQYKMNSMSDLEVLCLIIISGHLKHTHIHTQKKDYTFYFIYYGFLFWDFMGFLCVQMSVSVSLKFFFSSFFNCFVIIHCLFIYFITIL